MIGAATSGTTAGSALGVPAAFGLLLGCESGFPIPVPADLLMLTLGAAVSAGRLPWWVAVLGLEVVGVAGTGLLLFLARGPATALLARWGPRVGLSAARVARSASVIERRGWPALLTGRATPGLRTVTVLAVAASSVPARRALPALVAGSTLFLQAHLILGLAIGAPIRSMLATGSGRIELILVLTVAATAAVVVSRVRRRQATGRAWTEGVCPACLTLTYLRRPSRVTEPDAAVPAEE